MILLYGLPGDLHPGTVGGKHWLKRYDSDANKESELKNLNYLNSDNFFHPVCLAQLYVTLTGLVPSSRTFPCISSMARQACEDLANFT